MSPFAQDKHVDPDASRPGTGYTDIDSMQDERGIRVTGVEDDKQNDHNATPHIHKVEYLVVSYAGKKAVVHYIGLVLDEDTLKFASYGRHTRYTMLI